MKTELSGQVAVITGAGGGIGGALARMLAGKGMKIVLLGGRSAEKLENTRQAVEARSSCLVLPGDLTDISWLPEARDQILSAFGRIDVLINNAGAAMSTPFPEVTAEQFDRIMALNVRTPYFLCQLLLPELKKTQGTIINMGSVVSHAGYPLQSAYVASKHALLGFTKSMARELWQEGVRVHAICPGGVFTDMVKVSRPDLTGEGMIQPEEIADIVEFLLEHRGNGVIDEIGVHRVTKEPFLI